MYDHFRHKFTAFVLAWLLLSYFVTDNWSQFSVSIIIALIALVGFHFWKRPRPQPPDVPRQKDHPTKPDFPLPKVPRFSEFPKTYIFGAFAFMAILYDYILQPRIGGDLAGLITLLSLLGMIAYVALNQRELSLPVDLPLQSDYRIDFTIKPYKSLLGTDGFDLIVHSRFRNDFVAAARNIGAHNFTLTTYAPLTTFARDRHEKSINALLLHPENTFRVRTYQEAVKIQEDIQEVITKLKSQILVAGPITQGKPQHERFEG
jgi:hypothetical protein